MTKPGAPWQNWTSFVAASPDRRGVQPWAASWRADPRVPRSSHGVGDALLPCGPFGFVQQVPPADEHRRGRHEAMHRVQEAVRVAVQVLRPVVAGERLRPLELRPQLARARVEEPRPPRVAGALLQEKRGEQGPRRTPHEFARGMIHRGLDQPGQLVRRFVPMDRSSSRAAGCRCRPSGSCRRATGRRASSPCRFGSSSGRTKGA